MLRQNHKEWEFQFISLQGDNIKTSSYGLASNSWSSNLTVAVMKIPEGQGLLELIQLAVQLLSDGRFFGWAIAKSAPNAISSFRIHQPNEISNIPDGALLTFTLGFKVEMPDSVTKTTKEALTKVVGF